MTEMIAISLAYAPCAPVLNDLEASNLEVKHNEAKHDPVKPLKQKPEYLELSVPIGTTIYQALVLAGWLIKYDELAKWCEQIKTSPDSLATKPNARHWCVGIYSQKKPLDYELRANDRVEVYRPLSIDPMKRRKKRAKW